LNFYDPDNLNEESFSPVSKKEKENEENIEIEKADKENWCMKKHACVCDENLSNIDMMNEYPNENEKRWWWWKKREIWLIVYMLSIIK